MRTKRLNTQLLVVVHSLVLRVIHFDWGAELQHSLRAELMSGDVVKAAWHWWQEEPSSSELANLQLRDSLTVHTNLDVKLRVPLHSSQRHDAHASLERQHLSAVVRAAYKYQLLGLPSKECTHYAHIPSGKMPKRPPSRNKS